MKKLLLVLVSFAVGGAQANGYGLINLSEVDGSSRTQFSAGFSSVEFDIESDPGVGRGEIERQLIGGGVSMGFHGNMAFYAFFGFSLESSIEGIPGDDTGFLFGVGMKAEVYRQNKMTLNVFGDASYAIEEYGQGIEGTLAEFRLGSVANFDLARNLSGFFGLVLVPFSDGTLEIAGADVDIERDDMLGVIFGINFKVNKFNIRPEAEVIGEKRFSIMVDFAI